MTKVKLCLAGVAILSTLSFSGCLWIDPAHGGGHGGDRGGYGNQGGDRDQSGDRSHRGYDDRGQGNGRGQDRGW